MDYQFRTSITDSNRIAFGCSHTWGVGVESNETWPCYINAKNYGVTGCSSDLISRISKQLISKKIPALFSYYGQTGPDLNISQIINIVKACSLTLIESILWKPMMIHGAEIILLNK